ncbi:MAG: response regulator [Magnetococcales bacterium]|nr:response regulator [Magnetococcales bacterium]
MSQSDRILIVEDDRETRTLTREYLEENGLETREAENGLVMWEILRTWTPDLILMDLMLPGEDGLMLCKRLSVEEATRDIAIIMLTARGDEMDRILGLEMGADDYLSKPFSTRELLARIRSVLRRSRATGRIPPTPAERDEIRFGGWTLKVKARHLLSPDGVIVDLTKGEMILLQIFLQHPNETLNRDQLTDLCHAREATVFDRGMDVQVSRLRKRLRDDPKNPTLIKTVWGKGYMLTAEIVP